MKLLSHKIPAVEGAGQLDKISSQLTQNKLRGAAQAMRKFSGYLCLT